MILTPTAAELDALLVTSWPYQVPPRDVKVTLGPA
jgi:hypothetical protein